MADYCLAEVLKNFPKIPGAAEGGPQGWKRYFANPREVGTPGRRRKGENDGVLLTNELFRWLGDGMIEIGTKKQPVGILPFHQHRPCKEPNSLSIKHDSAGRWWLSFNFDDGVDATEPEDVISKLANIPDAEVAEATSGHDMERDSSGDVLRRNDSQFRRSQVKENPTMEETA